MVILTTGTSPLAVVTITRRTHSFRVFNSDSKPVNSLELRQFLDGYVFSDRFRVLRVLLHDVPYRRIATSLRPQTRNAQCRSRLFDSKSNPFPAMLLGLFFLSHRSELRW